MELLNSIFNFFTDKSQNLSRKALLIIGGIALLIIIDNTLSFSYYYNTEKRIEQIQGINKIINDTTITKAERLKLKNLRSELIIRNTWKDKTYKLLSEIDFQSESETEEIIATPSEEPEVNRSYLWHFISSGWVFIFVMIFIPFVGLADKKTSIGNTLGILLFIEPLFLGLAWVFAKGFSFIPVIYGNPIYNYILNFVLSFGVLFLMTKLGSNKTKKTTGNHV